MKFVEPVVRRLQLGAQGGSYFKQFAIALCLCVSIVKINHRGTEETQRKVKQHQFRSISATICTREVTSSVPISIGVATAPVLAIASD